MATSAFFFPPLAANDQYLADNLVSLLRETAHAPSHSCIEKLDTSDRGRFLCLETQEPSETAEKVVFRKKLRIWGYLNVSSSKKRTLEAILEARFL